MTKRRLSIPPTLPPATNNDAENWFRNEIRIIYEIDELRRQVVFYQWSKTKTSPVYDDNIIVLKK